MARAARERSEQERETLPERWAWHHCSQVTMSAGEGAASGSPYIVSDLKRASFGAGSGMNGGRRHQRSGAKRASCTAAVGHSRGRAATAPADRSTTLAANTAPTPQA